MLDFTIRRLLAAIPVLMGIIFIAFVVLYLIPGNPAKTLAGPRASEETVRRIARDMGLDQPLHERFVRYLGRIVRGDLGKSMVNDRPVMTSILEKFPYTLRLALLALCISVVSGLVAGTMSALLQRTIWDRLITMLSVAGISIPIFLTGLILLYVFAVQLRWFPTSAFAASSMLTALFLPALTLGIRSGAFLARITRSTMIEVFNEDYIRTARAKGLPPLRILWRHALFNALIPIVTVVALDLSSFLSGSVIVETIFDLPGLGRFAMEAISKRDYPVIQGVVLFSAIVFVGINLLVDLLYAFLNPRVRDEMLRSGGKT